MLDVNRLPLEGAGGLLDLLRTVTDPRQPRGVRHSVVSIVALATCAGLAGARSFEAIAQWAATLSRDALRRVGGRRRTPPSEPTFRRVLQRLDAETLDRQLGAWLARQQPLAGQGLAVDGKTLRGGHDGERPAPHLLSAVLHADGLVLAQRSVGEKTNEIPTIKPLLADLPLAGAVVTADALHTQAKTARYLVDEKHADYLFTVKDNQPTLKQDIQTLGLETLPPQHTDTDKGHGRIETRSIWTSTALVGYLEFPHVAQVFRVERHTTDLDGQHPRTEVAYGITSPPPAKADPARLLALNRAHWAIENRVHWVRDMTFDEDRCRARKGAGAHVLASLRNLVISLLRLARAENIAEALRDCTWNSAQAFRLIGLAPA